MLRRAVAFIRRSILRTVLLGLLFSFYLWFSVVSYIFLYQSIVPPVRHVAPIHLQFDGQCQSSVCSFPKARIQLDEDGTNILAKNQLYDISINLEVPESPVNQDLGMFMVNLTFHAVNKVDTWSSARAAILRYKSSLLSTARLLFYIVPMLLGFMEESQWLVVKFADNFSDSLAGGYEFAEVVVQTKQLQVYSATLVLDARFSGVRYLMYYWPIVSGILYISSVMWVLCSITTLVIIRLFGFRLPVPLPLLHGMEDSDDDDDNVGDAQGRENDDGGGDGQAQRRLEGAGQRPRGGNVLIGEAVHQPEQLGAHRPQANDAARQEDSGDDDDPLNDDNGDDNEDLALAAAGEGDGNDDGGDESRRGNDTDDTDHYTDAASEVDGDDDGGNGDTAASDDVDDDGDIDDIVLLTVQRERLTGGDGSEMRQRHPPPT